MNVSLSESLANVLAAVLLGFMFVLMFFSMRQDALTFDELAHIPAGYSYLTKQDYRINPEHPPLAKDIAAAPLLFLNLNFPSDSPNWTQKQEAPPWWIQFDLGTEFLYRSGNDPLSIIFWSRLPMILLMIALGWFIFSWSKRLLGNAGSLAVLTLFALSPSFLAHGRLVTTDVAAVFGAFVAIAFWIAFLQEPGKAKIIKAGIALAFAFLLKFSAALLLPFFAVITIAYALLYPHSFGKMRTVAIYIGLSILVGIVALAVILPIYQFHIWNYPAERQVRDTISDMQPGGITFYESAIISISEEPLLRSFAQFSRGILMATQRGQFGNTVFMLGDIKAGGWWWYFPAIYIFKVPLAFHLLSIIALAGIFWSMKKQWYRGIKDLLFAWYMKKHFAYFAFCLFIGIYWIIAMLGNLNIGVRHLLPTFPLLYILVVWGLKELISHIAHRQLQHIAIAIVAALFLWYAGSSLMAFPHYIPYYNELAGGTENGYRVAVDSNYDWGQDFYKLRDFVQIHNIERLYLDYFGGENPEFWLGEKYVKLDPFNPPESGWVAVSLNQLQGGLAQPAAGFDQPTGYYIWLKEYTATRIGNSIFVYHLQ